MVSVDIWWRKLINGLSKVINKIRWQIKYFLRIIYCLWALPWNSFLVSFPPSQNLWLFLLSLFSFYYIIYFSAPILYSIIFVVIVFLLSIICNLSFFLSESSFVFTIRPPWIYGPNSGDHFSWDRSQRKNWRMDLLDHI